MWSGWPRASQKAEGAEKMHSGRVRQAAVQRNAELWPAAARRRRDFGHCKRIAAGPTASLCTWIMQLQPRSNAKESE